MNDFGLLEIVILLILLYCLIYPIISRICDCITECERYRAFSKFVKTVNKEQDEREGQ